MQREERDVHLTCVKSRVLESSPGKISEIDLIEATSTFRSFLVFFVLNE
jgi:hypothetical protein